MAGGYTAVDLSQLPPPDVIEALGFEDILAGMLADLRARDPVFSALVESDPAFKILEVAAYREMLMRQRINEAAQAVMLPYARGADLDNLAALFGVVRLLTNPGDPEALPPVPPVYESDADFRRRVTLALEGYSTAGPVGAYIFHALSASGDVLDAGVTSPAPGQVLVSVLSRQGDGSASAELINAVSDVLSSDDVRPLTDGVTVQSATLVHYAIEAVLYFSSGPDAGIVLAAAESAAQAYADTQHRIGRDITLSGIYAALHQPGVQRVELVQPTASIMIGATAASLCTGISLTAGGIDD